LKLRPFLHVAEKMSPVVEHPFQGWLPYLKLVWQPSVQLLEVFSSAAILAMTEPCEGAVVWGVGDVGRDATVFATRGGLCGGLATCLYGLATCFGASTVTPGSWVCDIAAPLRPHNNAADRIAPAEGAPRLDEILMTRSSNSRHVRYWASIRMRYLFRFSAVTRNFPPASMPVQYHQDLFRSQPRNILVSMHCT
jgi:hypothetical protein